ncbi:MAG: hypothetical protein ACE5Q6_11105 [Dehalococcoidia bacterium]
MSNLTNQEVQAMGKAVGLNLQDPELTQVAHSLNALLEAMEEIQVPGVNSEEPLPLVIPEQEA